ncbi:HAMP domain-containing sensor histidine kinase [Hymenobacter jeollabukensis]|uniref:histidine kinase n=1 Tax=Hymenobacter jeollabukensis TaxID=2025313 RepID=A0A5R8WP33_9BACT|nr:HAMP domain-containing sensor histidine kinase [Hymenobacter jeollabukensis]TLM91837.1 HAMP domain-containing histidine kinase [Hymenobacter jeollabukensis]
MNVFRSLRGQLLLAFALVFGTVALLAGAYQYRQVGRLLHRGDDARLRARAEGLLAQVELGPLPVLPLPGQGERMRVVVETAGQPSRELFHSPGFADPPPPGWRGVMLTQERATDAGQRQRLRLWLSHSAAPLAADLGRVRRTLGWALAGSLGLAAALAALLGHWALRPLRRISRQAHRIGATPGPERLPEPTTGDEVQELARTLNQMLGRLQAGAEQQDNFLAAAAHELRTPLTVLRTGLEVARQRPDLPPDVRALLSGQLLETGRLSRLVEDFLLVSRLRAGALPLARQPLLLDELVLAVVDRELPRFREAGRSLHLAVAEDATGYQVMADADKLTSVLLNLLENALRHAPGGAAVQVQVGQEPATGWCYAEVSNPIHTSLGDLARLTTAYYQASVLSPGAGLGLWLSSRLAELHGGQLALSEANGCFMARLRLPLSGDK